MRAQVALAVATELPNPARGPGVLEETRGIAHICLWRTHIGPHPYFYAKKRMAAPI